MVPEDNKHVLNLTVSLVIGGDGGSFDNSLASRNYAPKCVVPWNEVLEKQ